MKSPAAHSITYPRRQARGRALRPIGYGLVLTVGAFSLAVVGTVPARAAPTCSAPVTPGQVYSGTPAEQRALAPDQVWPTTTGHGVTVALLDTGVDATHPQLRNAVTTGWDLVTNGAGGTLDCSGHGTAVASIIAARAVPGTGFTGLAPGARILPIRVSEQLGTNGAAVPAGTLADAIKRATDAGAGVIVVSIPSAGDTPRLKDAVDYARRHDAVLVATAGTGSTGESGGASESGSVTASGSGAPVYPAAYAGVLGVAAVDENGVRLPDAPPGPSADLVAPGKEAVVAVPGQGHTVLTGSDAATAVVSATAALVRAAYPRLSADDVARRILATTDTVPDAVGSPDARRMVDPYRAVTEVLTDQQARVLPAIPRAADNATQRQWHAHWRSRSHTALTAALILVAAVATAAALVGAVALVRHRGRLAVNDSSVDSSPASPAPAASLPGSGPDAADESEDHTEKYFTVPTPPRLG